MTASNGADPGGVVRVLARLLPQPHGSRVLYWQFVDEKYPTSLSDPNCLGGCAMGARSSLAPRGAPAWITSYTTNPAVQFAFAAGPAAAPVVGTAPASAQRLASVKAAPLARITPSFRPQVARQALIQPYNESTSLPLAGGGSSRPLLPRPSRQVGHREKNCRILQEAGMLAWERGATGFSAGDIA
jgi:hypothetical protein